MFVTGPCPDHALPLKVGEAVVALHVAEDGVEGGQGRSRGEEVLHVGIPRAVEAGHERKPGVFVEEHEPPGHSVAVRLKAYGSCVDGREVAANGRIAAARWKHRPWDTGADARAAGWRSSASLWTSRGPAVDQPWTSRGPAHDAKRWLTAEPQAGGLA